MKSQSESPNYEICDAVHVVRGTPLWYVRKDGDRVTLNFDTRDACVAWIASAKPKPADKARREDMIHRLFRDKLIFEPDPGNPKISLYVPPKWNDEEKAMEKDLRALESKISEDKRQMLHRLVDIRVSLWT